MSPGPQQNSPYLITGATDLYVVIGDPIAQVRSPDLFNAHFAAHGVDAVMVPVRIPAAGLKAAVAGLRAITNLRGIVITIPHKTTMLALVDEVLPKGDRSGGVNAVRCQTDSRWIADSFDGLGFVHGLRSQGREPKGRAVLVVGAGGAGSAIAVALAEAKVSRLTLFDIDSTKAQRVAAVIGSAYPDVACSVGAPIPGDHDIVVNATPLGMTAGDAPSIDPNALRPGTLVADVITKPEMTPLLEAAAGRGCATHTGRHMVQGQIAAISDFFHAT